MVSKMYTPTEIKEIKKKNEARVLPPRTQEEIDKSEYERYLLYISQVLIPHSPKLGRLQIYNDFEPPNWKRDYVDNPILKYWDKLVLECEKFGWILIYDIGILDEGDNYRASSILYCLEKTDTNKSEIKNTWSQYNLRPNLQQRIVNWWNGITYPEITTYDMRFLGVDRNKFTNGSYY